MSIAEKKGKAEARGAKWASAKHTCDTARNLKALGLLDEEIAVIFGFRPGQLARLKKNYPELKEAIAEGKKNLHDRLVAQMVLAAAGYDYDEVKVRKGRDGKILDTTTITKHIPANAPLFMFLMTNQWGDPTERWKGWKIRKDSLPSSRITIKIDGKTEAEKISKLAGKLFGEYPPEHPRKLVVASEISDNADGGCGAEERLSGVVPVKAADSV